MKLFSLIIPLVVAAIIMGQFKAYWNRSDDNARASKSQLTRFRIEPSARNDAQGGIPDVIVSRLDFLAKLGTIGNMTSYVSSTTSCNIGDGEAIWIDVTNQHPLIAENLYRLHEGRFEQIGMAWVKHSFCAVDENDPTFCGDCQANSNCGALAVGCSDTYNTGHNSTQSRIGPRSEANAATGVYPYPYGLGWQLTGDALYKRLQVSNDDLDPLQNVGAQYFLEAFYLTTDEPVLGNELNNASYRECFVGALSLGGYILEYREPEEEPPGPLTVPQQAAIMAWKGEDAGVQISQVEPTGDGLFHLGSRATDNGDGTWHYEYAVYNYNSDQSGQSFSIPLDPCVTVTNIGFHDVDYHSGEPYSGTDWTDIVAVDSITWSTQDYATNSNANALRWNTAYSFRFDADAPPLIASGLATIGLFKPGTDSSVTSDAIVPGLRHCPEDISGGDDVVDVLDLLAVLQEWDVTTGSPADFTGTAQNCPDGFVGVGDLIDLLAAWGPCP